MSDCSPLGSSDMEFSGKILEKYWSRLPFSTPGDLPDPGIKLESLASPARQVESFPWRHLRSLIKGKAMALLLTFPITDFASSVSISSSYLPHLSLAKRGFPDSSVGKDSACHARDPSSSPGSWRSPGAGIGDPLQYSWAFLVTQLQCGRPGFNPWVVKIPCRRERPPNPVFWPEEFRGLYSPWSHKELDTTERLALCCKNLLC